MKKFLLSLIVGFVGLISFGFVKGDYSLFGSDCTVSNPCTFDNLKSITYDPTGYNSQVKFYYHCLGVTNLDYRYYQSYRYNDGKNIITLSDVWLNCGDNNSVNFLSGFYIDTNYHLSPSQVSINYYSDSGTCPEINTGEILSGYVEQSQLLSCQEDLNSCQSSLSGYDNTLNGCSDSLISCQSSLNSCIQGNCPIDTGSVMWSAMFINGIQFPGYGLINVNIPDYITWDYSVNEDQFDLDVGSGYDVEYIESIIDINSYRPSSSDFTTIFVSGFTFIMPYIIFSLFLVFMRKLLKRIFK